MVHTWTTASHLRFQKFIFLQRNFGGGLTKNTTQRCKNYKCIFFLDNIRNYYGLEAQGLKWLSNQLRMVYNTSMAFLYRFIALFFVFNFAWLLASSLIELNSLHKTTKQKVESWSEELSFAALKKQPQLVTPKLYRLLNEDPRVLLVSSNPLDVKATNSTAQSPLFSSTFRVPVSYYGVPAGALEFKIHFSTLLAKHLSSSFFLTGFVLLAIITLTLLNLVTYLKTLKLNANQAERELQLRLQLNQQILHDLKSPMSLLNAIACNNDDDTHPEIIDSRLITKVKDRFQLIIDSLNEHSIEKKHKVKNRVSQSQVIQLLGDLSQQLSFESRQMLEIQNHVTKDFELLCSPTDFLRAFQNIATNAIESNQLAHKDKIIVQVRQHKHNKVLIEIRDFGKGFSPNQKVLKRPGRGIGIESTKTCLSKWGGTIKWLKSPDSEPGTRAQLTFEATFFEPTRDQIETQAKFELAHDS